MFMMSLAAAGLLYWIAVSLRCDDTDANFPLHDAYLSGGDEISCELCEIIWQELKGGRLCFLHNFRPGMLGTSSLLHVQHSAVSCQALFLVSFVAVLMHWYSKR